MNRALESWAAGERTLLSFTASRIPLRWARHHRTVTCRTSRLAQGCHGLLIIWSIRPCRLLFVECRRCSPGVQLDQARREALLLRSCMSRGLQLPGRADRSCASCPASRFPFVLMPVTLCRQQILPKTSSTVLALPAVARAH